MTAVESLTLAVAVLTAAIFGVFGFPFRNYLCWYSWSRLGTIAGVVLYLLIAGGGGGVIGCAAAYLSGAEPTAVPVLNGCLFGMAGALAARADFKSGPRRNPSSTQELRQAASAVGAGISWTSQLLDELARRRAEQWFSGLSDAMLVDQVLRLKSQVTARSEVPAAAKKQMLAKLADSVTMLKNPAETAEGRALLNGFCTHIAIGQHVPRAPKARNATKSAALVG